MADVKRTPRPPGQGPDLMRPAPETPPTPSGTPQWDQPPMFPWQLGPGQTNPNEPWFPSLDPGRLERPAEWIDPSAPKPGGGWQQMDPVIPLPGPGYKPSRWSNPSGPILGPPQRSNFNNGFERENMPNVNGQQFPYTPEGKQQAQQAQASPNAAQGYNQPSTGMGPMFGGMSAGNNMPRFNGMGGNRSGSSQGYGYPTPSYPGHPNHPDYKEDPFDNPMQPTNPNPQRPNLVPGGPQGIPSFWPFPWARPDSGPGYGPNNDPNPVPPTVVPDPGGGPNTFPPIYPSMIPGLYEEYTNPGSTQQSLDDFLRQINPFGFGR